MRWNYETTNYPLSVRIHVPTMGIPNNGMGGCMIHDSDAISSEATCIVIAVAWIIMCVVYH